MLFISDFFSTFGLRQGLSLTWNFIKLAILSGQWASRSPVCNSCLAGFETTSLGHQVWLLCGFWRSSSGLHTWKISPLLTDTSLQAPPKVLRTSKGCCPCAWAITLWAEHLHSCFPISCTGSLGWPFWQHYYQGTSKYFGITRFHDCCGMLLLGCTHANTEDKSALQISHVQ